MDASLSRDGFSPAGTPGGSAPGTATVTNTVLGHHPARAHSSTRRSRRALAITETELKLIAAAAIIGESSQPVQG